MPWLLRRRLQLLIRSRCRETIEDVNIVLHFSNKLNMASMAKSVVLVSGYAVHWRLFGMSIDALLIQRIINPHSSLGLFCHKFPK